MPTAFGSERRKMKSKPFRLDGPLFARVPRTFAAGILSVCALATISASNIYHPALSFGPIYMVTCAFGAWFVGCRFAFCLLAYIAGVEISSGRVDIVDFQHVTASFDFAIRIGAAITMIVLLSVARDALEIEWKFARRDPLTDALNRKAFFEAVAADTDDEGEEVLIFADVNNLKRVNDEFGHEAGDAALCDFATQMRANIRKGDLFARLGGDEFVILCKVQDRSAAKILAQRIDRVVNHNLDDRSVRLSCSIGVLALPQGSRDIDEELSKADKLMYLAKRQNIGAVMAVYFDGKLQHLRPLETTHNSSKQISDQNRSSKLRGGRTGTAKRLKSNESRV